MRVIDLIFIVSFLILTVVTLSIMSYIKDMKISLQDKPEIEVINTGGRE